jgi:hypothetical protein
MEANELIISFHSSVDINQDYIYVYICIVYNLSHQLENPVNVRHLFRVNANIWQLVRSLHHFPSELFHLFYLFIYFVFMMEVQIHIAPDIAC